MEIYESFGLSEDLLREAYHVLEVCFWGEEDGEDGKTIEGIKRKSRTLDTEKGLSHLPHVILNQARMNGLMLDKMEGILKETKGEGKIEYGWTTKDVQVDSSKKDDLGAYPCKVVAEKDGKEETWEAKYVLVCTTSRGSRNLLKLGESLTKHHRLVTALTPQSADP